MAMPLAGVYDPSALSTFQRCPRLYDIEYERRLEMLDPQAALIFGNMIHVGLAELYTSGDVEKAKKLVREYPGAEYARDAKRTPELAEALMHEYLDRWKLDETEVALDADGEKAIEIAFNLPLGDYTCAGRMDMVIRLGGQLWVLDHKTTSGIFFLESSHRPNLQFTTYTWACKQMFGECAGVIIDVIELPKGAFNKDKHFSRFPSPRSEDELKEFESDFVAQVETIERYRENGYFPKSESDCWKYYKNCIAWDACVHDVWGRLKEKEVVD